jgi:hypothetical protein
MKNFTTVLGIALGAIAIAALLIFLFAFPVMWLWNMLVPSTFGGPALTFWQTFGFMIMIRLILPTSTKSNKRES